MSISLFGKITIFILQLNCIALLVFFLILLNILIMKIILIICRIGKSWCQIRTDISFSLDNGITYTRNYQYNNYKNVVYLKYEITARASGFLANFHDYKIPLAIKAPESSSMTVSLLEYNGICDSHSRDSLVITKKTKFFLCIKGEKTETVKIVLKCKRNLDGTNLPCVFKLLFTDKYLRQKYSRTTVLEFRDEQLGGQPNEF